MTVPERRAAPLRLPRAVLTFDRPLVCAVLNITPDSFSDGGRLVGVESAVDYALELVSAGADMLDVGGESTRPDPLGARAVGADEEIARVVPVIAALAERTPVPISVDTTKAAVAAAAVAAGAQLVNDVSGGQFDPDIFAATGEAGYVLGHARGRTLAEIHASPAPTWAEVRDELAATLASMPGGLRERTIVDPGLGFGKGSAENLEHLARAGELGAALGRPVMIGPSRKRFLGQLTGRPVDQRDDATVGACLAGVAAGAHIVRVHDVRRVRDALVVFHAVRMLS